MSAASLNLHQKLLKIADAAGILQKTKAGYTGSLPYPPEQLNVADEDEVYGERIESDS